jgi:hypothetical protein
VWRVGISEETNGSIPAVRAVRRATPLDSYPLADGRCDGPASGRDRQLRRRFVSPKYGITTATHTYNGHNGIDIVLHDFRAA